MNEVNQKIIDSVIKKAEKVCPDSLALIGVYGSVATGDDYEKSDLDLLILIDDENGYELSTGFILEDSMVGYDIYCTNWDSLMWDSQCHHAHISKLMDSDIVYIKKQSVYEKLCELREQTKLFLQSDKRFERVNELIDKAKADYADACLSDCIGSVRLYASRLISDVADAIMLYHGDYFRLGVKRTFDELSKYDIDGSCFDLINTITSARSEEEIISAMKSLLKYTIEYTLVPTVKSQPCKGSLSGTYEEMYSNWRNKVDEAAKNNHRFASFANLCSLQEMINDISSEQEIGHYDLLEAYNPDDLNENTKIYDGFLAEYEKVYHKCGDEVIRYSDVNEFAEKY